MQGGNEKVIGAVQNRTFCGEAVENEKCSEGSVREVSKTESGLSSEFYRGGSLLF